MAEALTPEKCLSLNYMLFHDGLGIIPTLNKQEVTRFPIKNLIFHTITEEVAARSLVKTYAEFGWYLTSPQSVLKDKDSDMTMKDFAAWCSQRILARFE